MDMPPHGTVRRRTSRCFLKTSLRYVPMSFKILQAQHCSAQWCITYTTRRACHASPADMDGCTHVLLHLWMTAGWRRISEMFMLMVDEQH